MHASSSRPIPLKKVDFSVPSLVSIGLSFRLAKHVV